MVFFQNLILLAFQETRQNFWDFLSLPIRINTFFSLVVHFFFLFFISFVNLMQHIFRVTHSKKWCHFRVFNQILHMTYDEYMEVCKLRHTFYAWIRFRQFFFFLFWLCAVRCCRPTTFHMKTRESVYVRALVYSKWDNA